MLLLPMVLPWCRSVSGGVSNSSCQPSCSPVAASCSTCVVRVGRPAATNWLAGLSVCLSVCVSVCLSLQLSVCVCLSVVCVGHSVNSVNGGLHKNKKCAECATTVWSDLGDLDDLGSMSWKHEELRNDHEGKTEWERGQMRGKRTSTSTRCHATSTKAMGLWLK